MIEKWGEIQGKWDLFWVSRKFKISQFEVLLYFPLIKKRSIKNLVQKSVVHIQTNEYSINYRTADISTSDKEICYITGQFDTFLWGLFRRKVVCCHFVGPFLDSACCLTS